MKIYSILFLTFAMIQNASAQKIKVKSGMIQGIEYSYFQDNSCRENNNQKCLDLETYKEMCSKNEGLTKMAAGMLTTFDTIGSRLFYNGGDIGNMRVYWSNSQNLCRASITVSGILQGTSYRRSFDGSVTTFIINKQNELLVSSTNAIR